MSARTEKRYAVRKLDTDSPYFTVVDLHVPGAALVAPESVVARHADHLKAHAEADRMNGECREQP